MNPLTFSNSGKEHPNINTSAYMQIWYSAKHTRMDFTSHTNSQNCTYGILILNLNIKTIINDYAKYVVLLIVLGHAVNNYI